MVSRSIEALQAIDIKYICRSPPVRLMSSTIFRNEDCVSWGRFTRRIRRHWNIEMSFKTIDQVETHLRLTNSGISVLLRIR